MADPHDETTATSPAGDGSAGRRHVAIAGGGSGGHVFPGLAVAAEMAERGWRVSWLGRPDGLERRLLEGRGMAYHGLPAKPFMVRGAGRRAAALATLTRSSLAARRLLRRERVAAVLGTGGYVSAAGVLGARLARRPAVLLEPNAVAGAANRWLSRWARSAAVAYAESAAAMACPATVTGVPVRSGFFDLPPAAPAAEPFRLLVLGGSQGARQINELVPAAVARLRAAGRELTVVHQVGAEHVEAAAAAYRELGLGRPEVEVMAFLDDVAASMGAADLVLSRAGAITLAEICAAGRPALLIPYGFAGGHQADNAAPLVTAGGGVALAAAECTADGLADALARLLDEGPGLAKRGNALRRLARPGAAAAIADLVEEAAA